MAEDLRRGFVITSTERCRRNTMGLLLSCEAAKRVVYGYHPKPEGANFKLERFVFFKSKTGNMFRPSDVMGWSRWCDLRF